MANGLMPLTDPDNGLMPYDPETAGAVATSRAMEPATTAYLQGVGQDFTNRFAYAPEASTPQGALDPQGIERAMNVAMGVGPGVIAGERGAARSAMADKRIGALDDAVALEFGTSRRPPADRDAIFSQTGWFRGADGDWKFILSDEGSRLRTENFGQYNYTSVNPQTPVTTLYHLEQQQGLKLGDVLEHNDLYDAYPDLKNYPVKRMPPALREQGLEAGFDPEAKVFYLAPQRAEAMHESLTHEVTHAIQEDEGFGTGSSPSQFLPATHGQDVQNVGKELDNINKEITRAGFKPDQVASVYGLPPYSQPLRGYEKAVQGIDPGLVSRYSDVLSRAKNLDDIYDQALGKYFNVAGEVDAYYGQAALRQRVWDKPPWEVGMVGQGGRIVSYPPYSQQIVIRANDGLRTLEPVDHDPFAKGGEAP